MPQITSDEDAEAHLKASTTHTLVGDIKVELYRILRSESKTPQEAFYGAMDQIVSDKRIASSKRSDFLS